MSVVTHNEFNSHMRRLDEKLDAHARQMDAHARSLDEKLEIYAHHMDEKLEVYARQMEGQITRLDERIENNARLLDRKIDSVTQTLDLRVQSIEKQHQAFVVESRSLKTTVITTGIAVVVGVGAFNATVLSSMNASFESGKNTATSLMQASTELRQTQERMERLFGEMQKHDALQPDQ
jgi:hypothetical protein